MELDQLRCFLAAARLLNFRAASATVGHSPAAFGKRIAALEDALGERLFARSTRSVALTTAGLALVPEATRVVEAASDCLRAVRGELGAVPQSLTLGTRAELGLSWLLPLIPQLERAQPGLRLHLFVSSGPDLERLVRNGEIDAAVSSRPVTDPAVRSVRLHEEHYRLVGAAPLLRERPVDTLDDLRAHTLVDVSPELDLSRYWRDALPPEVEVEWGEVRLMGSLALLSAWVHRGGGLAVLPAYAIQPALRGGELVEILPQHRPRSDWFRLLTRRGDPRESVFSAIADFLRVAPLR